MAILRRDNVKRGVKPEPGPSAGLLISAPCSSRNLMTSG